MTAGGPAAYMYMGQGSSCLQWVHGGGGPAAYRGYMWAGDPAAHSGYMRAGGSGGCMGAGSPAAYMKAGGGGGGGGGGGQLITVDMWGRRSSC